MVEEGALDIPEGVHPAAEVIGGHLVAGKHDGGHFGAIDLLDEGGQGGVATIVLDLEGPQDKVFIQEVGRMTISVNEIARHVV